MCEFVDDIAVNNSPPFDYNIVVNNSPPCISFIVSLLIYSDWFAGNVDVDVDVATAALVANLFIYIIYILLLWLLIK